MKYYLVLALALLSMNLNKAHAQSNINITSPKHEYSMYPYLLVDYGNDHQDNLSEFLGKELECRLVKVKTNIYSEPGIFRKGLYNLTVTAICNKSFSDMKIKLGYGDYGNPWSLTLSYTTADGQSRKFRSEATSRDD